MNRISQTTAEAQPLEATLSGASDTELLELYIHSGDREALAEIVERYGPLVATVCRTTVSDPQAAEDAFQATFLVLIKSAGKIKQRESLGSWLYGVAYRNAVRVRKQARIANEQLVDNLGIEQETVPESANPVYELARKIELETLSTELQRMPDNLRCVLVEHYFLGHSAPAIADRMDLSTSAVEGRLRRGRRSLRRRLAQRGVSMSIVLAACTYLQRSLAASELGWDQQASLETLSALSQLDGTSPSADAPANTISPNPNVSSLVSQELSMLSIASGKITLAALVTLAAGVTMFTLSGIGTAQQGNAGQSSASTTQILATEGSQDGVSLAMRGDQLPPRNQTSTVLSQFGNVANQPATLNGSQQAATQPAPQTALDTPKEISWQTPPEDVPPPNWLVARDPRDAAIADNKTALGQKINPRFHEAPLQDVFSSLSEDLGVEIWINDNELDAIGIDRDTAVTLDLRNPVTVQTALQLMLTPLELGYRVGEVIEITSIDGLDRDPDIQFYDLSYILPNSSNADSLLNAIQNSITPDGWLQNGGQSSISIVGSMMVVAAPYSTQAKVERFLANIKQMNRENAKASQPASGTAMGMGGFGGGMGGMGGGGGGGGMF